jgi:hypothetical protein
VSRARDHAWGAESTSPEVAVGWRLWRVVPWGTSSVRLTAWSSPELIWPARTRCEARCLVVAEPGHLVPQPGCRCGLHAFATRDAAADALAAEMLPGAIAIGRVSLWGRLVQHAGGWRALHGYPYDVQLLGDDEELARRLRDAYAVDVSTLPVADLLRGVAAERRRRFAERMGDRRAAA